MAVLDLRKQWKHLYAPSAKKVELVDVPELRFVMIDGRIEPAKAPGTSPAFSESMDALYSAAYTLKFMSKLCKFDIAIKDNWVYTLMIMQPDHITPAMFAEAVVQAAKKKPNPALARLRLESFCALHEVRVKG